jgi:hypothetical protein
MPAADQRSRSAVLGVLLLYTALLVVGMAHHEMWRDELQAWQLVRDAASPAAVLHAMRYEGHPAIWHLLLFVASRVTKAPVAMQVVHALVAVAGVAIFLRLAPFALPLRALLALGYLPLFEYGVLSRNYALALPFLWLACHACTARPRRWWLLAATLAVMANTNPFAWLLAGAWAAVLLLEAPAAQEALGTRQTLGAAAVVGTGLLLAFVQMVPPADAMYPPTNTRWSASWAWRTLGTVVAGDLPLPDPRTRTPWNSALVYRVPPALLAVLAVVLVALVAFLLPARSLARRFYVLGTATLLAFAYTRFMGFARHHGHHWLLLVVCCWLAEGVARATPGAHDSRRRARLALLAILGVVHLVTGVWLWRADLRGIFSGAPDIGARLAEPPLDRLAAYGAPDPPLAAVAAYAGRPLVSLRTLTPMTYVLWRRGAETELPRAGLCGALLGASAQHPESFALVTNPLYDPRPCVGFDVHLIAVTPRALEPSERLSLWWVRRAPVPFP